MRKNRSIDSTTTTIPTLTKRLLRITREYRRKHESQGKVFRESMDYREIIRTISKIVHLKKKVFGENSTNFSNALISSSHIFMDLAIDKLEKKQYEQSFDIAKEGLKLIPASAYQDKDKRFDFVLSRFHEVFAAYHFYRNALKASIVELETCQALVSSSDLDTACIMISKSAILSRQGNIELARDIAWGAVHILEAKRKDEIAPNKKGKYDDKNTFLTYDVNRTFPKVKSTHLLSAAYFNCASSYEMGSCFLDSLRLYRLALSCRNNDEDDVGIFELPATLLLFRHTRKQTRCRSMSVQRWGWKEKFRVRREQMKSFKELTELRLRHVSKAIEEEEKEKKSIKKSDDPADDQNDAKIRVGVVEEERKKSKMTMKTKERERRKKDSAKQKTKKMKNKATKKHVVEVHKIKKNKIVVTEEKKEMNVLESIRRAASNIMKDHEKLVENIKRFGKSLPSLRKESPQIAKRSTSSFVNRKYKQESSSSLRSPPASTSSPPPLHRAKIMTKTFSSTSSAKKLYGTPARTVKALRLLRATSASRHYPRRFNKSKHRAVMLLRRQNQELLKCIGGGEIEEENNQ